MYYGHMNHKRFDASIHQEYVWREETMPLIVFSFILALLFALAIVSFEVTKEESLDKTHTHYTLFTKPMIYEDGMHRSHHFMHPDKCPKCKEIIENINKKN